MESRDTETCFNSSSAHVTNISTNGARAPANNVMNEKLDTLAVPRVETRGVENKKAHKLRHKQRNRKEIVFLDLPMCRNHCTTFDIIPTW